MNIIKVLSDYRIDYDTEGKNTSTGFVSIACPWCEDDPSHHLGINLKEGYYTCWRSSEHRGKDIR